MEKNSKLEEDIIAKFIVKDLSMYVKLLWINDEKDLFHIKLFYEDDTWTGTYSCEMAAKRLIKLDETKEEYNENVKNCFCGNSNNYIFDFTVSPDDINSASFAWKKQYEGAVKVHGTVTVLRDKDPISKDILLDILLEKNKTLLSEIEQEREINNNQKQELDLYRERLKELTETKILLESTLYGRFVQVLNEKKKRIQLLEEKVKSFQNT